MSESAVLTGKLPGTLANAVSDAIFAATQRGMDLDEACCIVVAVAADYARGHYSNAYLPQLAEIVTDRANRPLPMGAGS